MVGEALNQWWSLESWSGSRDPFSWVSVLVSNVSGLVSVSNDFGLGLESLVSRLSDIFYNLDIWRCAFYFVTALFKELILITIIEMWGLESRSRTSRSRSRSRLLWQSLGLGLVSKSEPGLGLGLGGYGLDYITALNTGQAVLSTYQRNDPTQDIAHVGSEGPNWKLGPSRPAQRSGGITRWRSSEIISLWISQRESYDVF